MRGVSGFFVVLSNMDVKHIQQILSSVPWWAWAVVVLGVLLILGDRKVWEFEVAFLHQDGVGKGEVEFEYYTNRKPILEVELDLDPQYLNKALEVIRNGQRVILIPATSNARPKLRIQEPYRMEKPAAGDLIEIKCAGKTLFHGDLRAVESRQPSVSGQAEKNQFFTDHDG